MIQREKDKEEMEIGEGRLVQVERLEKGQVKVIPKGKEMEREER